MPAPKREGDSSNRAGGPMLHGTESGGAARVMTLLRAQSCAHSKLKIRLQSSFMLTTVQPRCWASLSATSSRPIGETR